MLEPLFNIANNAKTLNINEILVDVYSSDLLDEYILDLNRINQLFVNGENTEGNIIGFYSARTDLITRGETFNFKGLSSTKKQGETFTLYDTGKFYKSFRIKINSNGFTILADDSLADGGSLTDKYGSDIIGLSDESKTELAQKLVPYVREYVRNILFA